MGCARLWRYPPGTRGRRHADEAQEEVFVIVSGTLTMLLGEPPERRPRALAPLGFHPRLNAFEHSSDLT
jgi:hypothetical protein